MASLMKSLKYFGLWHSLFLLLLPIAASPLAAHTVFIYVTDSAADTVEVIDPLTNTVV